MLVSASLMWTSMIFGVFYKILLVFVLVKLMSACCDDIQEPMKRETVHLTGTEYKDNVFYPVYWKDDVKTTLPLPAGADRGSPENIAIFGNDVYLTGTAGGNAVYWKNGTLMPLIDDDQDANFNDITVSKNRDILIVGQRNEPGTYHVTVWKNGVATDLPMEAYFGVGACVFATENSVYVGGREYDNQMDKPIIWKDGVRQELRLPPGFAGAVAAIFVAGDDIFVAGQVYDYDARRNAMLWKNGEPILLSDQSSYAVDIKVSDGDVFVVGIQNDSPVLWKNGVVSKLTDRPGYVQAIEIVNSSQVIAGTIWDEQDKRYATIWRDGVETRIDSPNSIVASDMAIQEK